MMEIHRFASIYEGILNQWVRRYDDIERNDRIYGSTEPLVAAKALTAGGSLWEREL